MENVVSELMNYLRNPQSLVAAAGLLGLTMIIFAETGLLIGFFLPGDSLLITAGIFAATGALDVWQTGVILTVAAIIGDAVGFWIGSKTGPLLYKKQDSFFFRRSHLLKAHEFYEEHGGKTIILARFIPIIRTFAPTVAGAAGMSYKKFVLFNIVGGFVWIWSMLLGGYYLGRLVPNIEQNIHYVVIGVIFLSVCPIFWNVYKARAKNASASSSLGKTELAKDILP